MNGHVFIQILHQIKNKLHQLKTFTIGLTHLERFWMGKIMDGNENIQISNQNKNKLQSFDIGLINFENQENNLISDRLESVINDII